MRCLSSKGLRFTGGDHEPERQGGLHHKLTCTYTGPTRNTVPNFRSGFTSSRTTQSEAVSKIYYPTNLGLICNYSTRLHITSKIRILQRYYT
jgi:hypothetical protein